LNSSILKFPLPRIIIAEVEGGLSTLLTGERTALNFIQRLSGIATNVRGYVNKLKNHNIRLVDTRKTAPGWRTLEKYAVRVGGAFNHRMGLYDGVLIKDNHIAVCGGVKQAIEKVRKRVSHLTRIEVEVANISELEDAVACGADVIMLDNMDIPHIKEAVEYIDERAVIEISGGVTIEDIDKLADTGVDIISVGALTHAARSVDISMRIKKTI